MDDAALEAAIFPPQPSSRVARAEPDWEYIHRELKRPTLFADARQRRGGPLR